MQYNFEVRTTLSDEETAKLVSKVFEGLEASSQLILEAKIRVNTELPDENVDALKEAVSNLMSKKLGAESEAQLISKEY